MVSTAESLRPRAAPLDWRQGWRPALLGWVAARIAVFSGFVLAHVLSGSLSLPDGRLHLDEGLMTWDGTYYRVLAEGWYTGSGTPGDAVRFFPLFPGLGKVLSLGGAFSVDVPLLLLANASALFAAVVIWQLVNDQTSDVRLANRAAWMVGIIPAANVYVFAYSESLMLLITAAALLYLNRQRLGITAALGLFAGLLRPSGILLAVPIVLTGWVEFRAGLPKRQLLRWIAPIVAPGVGLMTALGVINYSSGDFLAPIDVQRQLRDGFRDPVTRIGQAVLDFTGGHLHDVYNVAFAIGFLLLIIVAWRYKQPLPWIAYMAVTWVVAVGGNNMDSVGRYCVVAAPFTIALAQWANRRWAEAAVLVVGFAGTVWFTSEVVLGRIIP